MGVLKFLAIYGKLSSLPAQSEYSSSPVDFDEFQVVSLFEVKLCQRPGGEETSNDLFLSCRKPVTSGMFVPFQNPPCPKI